jgi:hypothetical protein
LLLLLLLLLFGGCPCTDVTGKMVVNVSRNMQQACQLFIKCWLVAVVVFVVVQLLG